MRSLAFRSFLLLLLAGCQLHTNPKKTDCAEFDQCEPDLGGSNQGGHDAGHEPNDGGTAQGDDAGLDAMVPIDASPYKDGGARDAGTRPIDASPEAGGDAGDAAGDPDAAADAGPDAGQDAGHDAATDAGHDAATQDARVPSCGDHVLDPGEACDDGNGVDGDGCDTNCTATACGNGVKTAGEACDDHNLAAGDGCSATCTLECGDGTIEGQEQCDQSALGGASCTSRGFAGGTLRCSAACTFDTTQCTSNAVCNDGTIEAGEDCEDGNTANGDGCSDLCRTEPVEIEPNEDGSPSSGGGTTGGNDFDATAVSNADRNGAFDATNGPVNILAAIAPAGDEDVFAFKNSTSGALDLRLDTWNRAQGFGFGVACAESIDTAINVRDAAGNVLASNDDRAAGDDRCAGVTYTLAPGQTVYAQVLSFGDANPIAGYVLEVRYLPIVCGDGTHSATEECDDHNIVNGDGCSGSCVLEGITAEVEPNNTLANATGNAVQITGNTKIRGAIGTTGDADVYRVTVATTGVVRFETFTSLIPNDCAANVTLNLRLLNGIGTTLLSDTAGQGINDCAAIVLYMNAGTYYIRVEETGNDATVGNYFLEVAFQTNRGAESEAVMSSGTNDTRASASSNLNPGSDVFVFGDHSLNNDSDFYSITVPAGAGIRAEVIEGSRTTETCESNGVDSRLTLYDATGTQLVDDDDNGRGFCSLIDGTGGLAADTDARNVGGTDQTFYLQVRRSASSMGMAGQFSYRLQVTLRK